MLQRAFERNSLVLIVATVVLGAPIAASGQAAANHEVQQVRRNASYCRTDSECFKACKNATEQRDSTEFRGLADKCNELYAAFARRRAQAQADAIDGSILKDGYSWMADVDVVVGSPRPGSRGYPLIAEAREDWMLNCPDNRRSPRQYFLDGPVPEELQIPGTKIRLKQIQYKRGSCIIGQVEVLGR